MFAVNDSNVDYKFIINGGKVGIEIPSKRNIKVYKRPNIGMEFCGINEILEKNIKKDYKYFIFLNGSIRGPFLPKYLKSNYWIEGLISSITDKKKLSGITINCNGAYEKLHIQSFLLVTDMTGLNIIRPSFRCYEKKQDAINNVEVAVSQKILKAGFNLASMMAFWYDHNFNDKYNTLRKCNIISSKTGGDLMYPNQYFGMDPNPFELMFVKTNRRIAETKAIEFYSRYT